MTNDKRSEPRIFDALRFVVVAPMVFVVIFIMFIIDFFLGGEDED